LAAPVHGAFDEQHNLEAGARLSRAARLALSAAGASVVLLLGCACTTGDRAGTAPVPVPPEYAATYQSMSEGLAAWEKLMDQLLPEPAEQPLVFGAHLDSANGNRASALLDPATLARIDSELDRLVQLGVRGITLDITFPLLNADYPHSAEYLEFYAAVAQRIRDRKMTLTVDQQLALSGTDATTVAFDYTKLPLADFTTLYRTMAQAIVDRLHPDYLTLMAEPDTFAARTGYFDAAKLVQGALPLMQSLTKGLNRGTTKLGAGAGAWVVNAGGVAFELTAKARFDYISLHVRPVDTRTPGLLRQVVENARLSRAPIVIDSAWQAKIPKGATANEGVVPALQAFPREAFSFWAPLDARFLGLLVRFARMNNVVYVAPSSSTLLFAYADYNSKTNALGYAEFSRIVDTAAKAAIKDGTFSVAGEAYRAAMLATAIPSPTAAAPVTGATPTAAKSAPTAAGTPGTPPPQATPLGAR
jgi:hypothetical protein